jgi:hypothetical protein
MTLRDPNQIVSAEHDELNNAKRVIIVAGEMPEFKMPQTLNSSVTPEVLKIEVPVIVKETQIEKIEVPVIIKEPEIKIVEVPIIVKEIQIEKVEIPIIIKEYEKITLPAETREVISKEVMPKWAIILLLVQTIIATLAILF